jgi:hypothetical protein
VTLRRAVTLVVLLLTVHRTAGADSARPLGLDELIDGAEEIVVGEVIAADGRWEGKLVVTDTTVRVDESLKGGAPREITLTQPGGTAVHPRLGARVTTTASGMTALRPGEQVVLFVARQRGRRQLVGGAQGKLVVRDEPGGEEPAGDAAAKRRIPRALSGGPKRLRVEPGAGTPTIGTRNLTLDELRARVRTRIGKERP